MRTARCFRPMLAGLFRALLSLGVALPACSGSPPGARNPDVPPDTATAVDIGSAPTPDTATAADAVNIPTPDVAAIADAVTAPTADAAVAADARTLPTPDASPSSDTSPASTPDAAVSVAADAPSLDGSASNDTSITGPINLYLSVSPASIDFGFVPPASPS